MRSISYIMGSAPKCFDDCFDRANKNKLLSVNIRLVVTEYTMPFHDEIVAQKELFAIFVWAFENNTYSHKDKLSACVSLEPVERQQRSVDNANYRLSILINRIKDLNVQVTVTPESFTYDKSLYK